MGMEVIMAKVMQARSSSDELSPMGNSLSFPGEAASNSEGAMTTPAISHKKPKSEPKLQLSKSAEKLTEKELEKKRVAELFVPKRRKLSKEESDALRRL